MKLYKNYALCQSLIKQRLLLPSSHFLKSSHNFSQKLEIPENYEVLHTSELPTMHFQNSLLRLPIPDLAKTCSRYLRSQKAILTPAEYAEAEKAVKDFGDGPGLQLQKILKAKDKANKHTSYISQPWFDMYLSDRASIVLNYNPFLMFLPEERKGYDDPVIRASNLLIASMRFLNTLKKGVLEPEVYHLNPAKSDTPFLRKLSKLMPSSFASYAAYAFKAFPLDMSQFKNLFHSTRIPQTGKDFIQDFPSAKHMLMMNKGNFYIFDLFDQDGNLYPPSHIHACVDFVYKDSHPAPKFPVSILTSEERDIWADIRKELLLAGNEETLRLIDSAAFNLVFDDVAVGIEPEKCFRTFLYGNGANRWFDKSFSLIVTHDGSTALNFEHAWGDGVAVMRYFNEVVKDMSSRPLVHPDSRSAQIDASRFVKRLAFKTTPKIETAIKKALETYERRTSSLAVDVLETDVLGKDLCKRKSVSPDAIMQLGFQLAYFMQNGEAVGTYESCSTSAFKHGRTETLRPATIETTSFCRAVCSEGDGRSSMADLKKAVIDCSSRHGVLTKEAAMGQGFDRHLFGLKKLAEENDSVPDLFRSYTYAKMNHNVLSTSTLPSPYINFGGFAPVVPDGFGVGYQIKDDKIGIALSSYQPLRNGREFLECAEKAYEKIRNILDHS